MYRSTARIVLFLVLLMSLGCAPQVTTPTNPTPGFADVTATPQPPAPEPSGGEPARVDIKGNISDVQAAAPGSDRLGTIRIEGEKIAGNTYDKAVVTVTKDTEILRKEGDALVAADFSALSFGDTVTAEFTGPVLESYPVQAGARRIVILAEMPNN